MKQNNALTGGANSKPSLQKTVKDGMTKEQPDTSTVKPGGMQTKDGVTIPEQIADPCEVLDAFLAIDQQQIEADRLKETNLRKAESIIAELKAIEQIPMLNRTLTQHVRRFHIRLLRDWDENCAVIELEVSILSRIVEDVIKTLLLLASERKSLSEFILHVKEIAGEIDSVEEESQNHDVIRGMELHEPYLQISVLLIPRIMRQYNADYHVDLFEKNRMLYDVMNEVGGRFIPEWERRWGTLKDNEDQKKLRHAAYTAREQALKDAYGQEGIDLFIEKRDKAFSGIVYASKEVEEADRMAKADPASKP